MAEGRTLGNIFSRYSPSCAETRKIIEHSSDAHLSGDRERKAYEVHFSLPFIAPKNDIYKLEKELQYISDYQRSSRCKSRR